MIQFFEQLSETEKELLKARQFLEQGKFEEGGKLMIEILGKSPGFLPVRLEYADFLLTVGEFFKALNVLRGGLKSYSENLELRYLLGVARQKCWLLHLAEKDFDFLRQTKPRDAEILRQIGWTKVLKGELEEGRKLLREAIDLNLTKSLPYLDLGASYGLSLDFQEAFKWLETAKHLKPQHPFVLEKLQETERIEREFEKFSEKEKRMMREMRRDPQELKLMAIKNLLLFSQQNSLTKDDFDEIREEVKLAGFNSKMMAFRPPETKKEKVIFEYMAYQHKIPDVERKISWQEFEEAKEKLLSPKTKEQELKKLLLILAHQGTKEAVNFLKGYQKKASNHLKDWAKLALEECAMFSKAKPGQVVQILHQDER